MVLLDFSWNNKRRVFWAPYEEGNGEKTSYKCLKLLNEMYFSQLFVIGHFKFTVFHTICICMRIGVNGSSVWCSAQNTEYNLDVIIIQIFYISRFVKILWPKPCIFQFSVQIFGLQCKNWILEKVWISVGRKVLK